MTVDKNKVIKLPVWFVVIIVPIIVAGITAFATAKFQDGKLTKQVEINTKNLDNKVDEAAFNLIVHQLDRIENKVDVLQKELN